MFPKLDGLARALAGAGIGVAAAGLQRGGISGLGMSIGGGALTGAAIGSIIPGIGTLIALASVRPWWYFYLIRLGISGLMINCGLPQTGLWHRCKGAQHRDQIAAIINSKYGGSISLAFTVRMYRILSGSMLSMLGRARLGCRQCYLRHSRSRRLADCRCNQLRVVSRSRVIYRSDSNSTANAQPTNALQLFCN
jgi:hypothetical protein